MDVEKKIWIYDLEQLKNFHSGTFMERDNPENVRVFVIHSSRDDKDAYFKFLTEEVGGLIGFNNLNYDYPLLHFFMAIMPTMVTMTTKPDGLNYLLYEESQRILNTEYSAVSYSDVKIPQLDLFRIHHFDNKAKRTSLKYVEINIQYPNVQDLPFEHDHWIEDHEVQTILDYNFNDVDATRLFYIKSEKLVELRKKLGSKYKLNLLNANDPKIGQEIFGREIAKKTGIRYSILKDMRTYRRSIDLGECIIDNISFESEEFNKILNFFKRTTILTTYKAFEESVIYKGFKYDYGTGGLHGCIEAGIYESDELHEIVDIDVKSYYPNIAISNEFYPRHLGKSFVVVYKDLFDQRLQAQQEGDKAMNSGLKLALNGAYGKSNDQYSLFYDPQYTMKITINGQLMLSMLAESLALVLGELIILQVNTDGITIKIPRNYRGVVDRICKEWEEKTGLMLEYANYKKMIIRDVNNYLAVDLENNAKPKGCFEIIPMQNGAIAYNKNWSMRIVPKAIHAYYIDGIKPEDFITTHNNIYDFCIGFRAKAGWDIWANGILNNSKWKRKQQKTIRYYMSKSGVVLTKENRDDDRIISLEAGRTATIFNQYVDRPMADYNIDYNYYIREINKIINAVDTGQLKLWTI